MILAIGVGVVALANVISLAKTDAAYCATDVGDTLKIAISRNPCPVSEDVAKLGGGALLVLIPPQEGGAVFGEGIGAHGTYVVGQADGVRPRFLFVSGRTFAADPMLTERLKSGKLKMVGRYSVTAKKGIVRASGREAGYAVLMDPEAPAADIPSPSEEGSRFAVLVSAISSFAVLAWCGATAFRRRRIGGAVQ